MGLCINTPMDIYRCYAQDFYCVNLLDSTRLEQSADKRLYYVTPRYPPDLSRTDLSDFGASHACHLPL